MNEDFKKEMKQKLIQMADEYREALNMDRKEFDSFLSVQDVHDIVEMAEIQDDSTILGLLGIQEREKLQRILSALFKIDNNTYGKCESCGGNISIERLRAMPEAQLCKPCKERLERV